MKHPDAFEAAEREANPGLDLLAEAKKAFAWEQSHKTRRKHDHGRYLHSWFSRAQDGNGVRERSNGSNGSNGSGNGNGSLKRWWDVASANEMRSFLKRRSEVAPELDPGAPVGITSVLRDGEWVELSELHDLSQQTQAAVLARLGREQQRDAQSAARMRGEAP